MGRERLPGMDGYAFCRELKNDTRTSGLPVVFVSASDTLEARLEGFDAGGEDFIVKPFNSEELLQKVRIAEQTLRQRSGLEEQAQMAARTAFSSMMRIRSERGGMARQANARSMQTTVAARRR